MIRTSLIASMTVVLLAGTAQAQITLSAPSATKPVDSSTAFNAVGTKNQGNQKARLEAAGVTTQQGGNPANGWFNDVRRSWEVRWDNSTGTVEFDVFASDDWTGLPAMSMSRTPLLDAGNQVVGIAIGTRTTNTTFAVELIDVQFDGGNGFSAVSGVNGVYTGNTFFERYFGFNGGPGDFAVRGITLMTGAQVTGDSSRFFVTGVQAIPTPGSAAILGLAGLAAARRRR